MESFDSSFTEIINNELNSSIKSRINPKKLPDPPKLPEIPDMAFDYIFKQNFNPNLQQMPFNNNNNNDNIMKNQGVESEKDKRSFTIKENNDAGLNNKVNQNDQNNDSNNKQKKNINLNILYYDENLKLTLENKDICSYFEMNLSGTFYGCHSFELFNNVCKKIKRNNTKFILISSGSEAKKIF